METGLPVVWFPESRMRMRRGLPREKTPTGAAARGNPCPCSGYCKQCCDEHWGTCVSFNSGYLGVYTQQWDCWVVWMWFGAFPGNYLKPVPPPTSRS